VLARSVRGVADGSEVLMLRHVLGALVLGATSLTVGCSTAEPLDDSASALSALDPLRCASPTVSTGPKVDASGQPIDGSALSTLSGCILANAGESGEQLLSRASALLVDTAKFGELSTSDHRRVFSKFELQPVTGTLATGLTQEVEVELNQDHSPSARLRFVRRQSPGGELLISISNVTPLVAHVVLFTVTVIDVNGLVINLHFKPGENGLRVNGDGEATLKQQKERAPDVSLLVKNLFDWATGQLSGS
jgi:hypothetical protein